MSLDDCCPLCGGDNCCRIAKGQLYKGPCWCHELTIPGHILTRLAGDSINPACFCRHCLKTIARVSAELQDTDAILAEIHRIVAENSEVAAVVPNGGGGAYLSAGQPPLETTAATSEPQM